MDNFPKFLNPETIGEFEELPNYVNAVVRRLEVGRQAKPYPNKFIKSPTILFKASQSPKEFCETSLQVTH